jgi:molybdate transport system ATP-binding protein
MIDIDVHIELDGAEGDIEAHYKLAIKKGEFITLFGASGAGKTTLLRILAGLETPKGGVITVDNEIWFDSSKKINLPPQKRSIGFVFQDYALFPTMSVRENLLYANKQADIDGLLAMMELTSLASTKPQALSGGQKQRVALARALAREPKILLLDEPLSALDNAMRAKLQEELTMIHDKLHITTLLVSHDIDEASRLSDRVALIDSGVITKIDIPNIIFPVNKTVAKIIAKEGNKITLELLDDDLARFEIGSEMSIAF